MIELIILVDYENVQPAAEDLADLEVGKHLLKVFHGPGQNSMPIKLATTLMPVGAAVEFIQCEKAGKDALDFHLSFHFGRLSIQHPQAQYVIVSRDRKGFSQLIEHGSKLGIKVTLVPSLRDEDMNDDGTPVVRAEPVRKSTRSTRPERSRNGRRDEARSAPKPASRPAPRQAPKAVPQAPQPAVVPAPVPSPAPVDEVMRDAVEQLMADIVASDDEDAPAVATTPAPAKKAATKKAATKKAAAKKAPAKKVAAEKAPAKKATAKKAARKTAAKADETPVEPVAEAIVEPVADTPLATPPAPAKKAARKSAARKSAAPVEVPPPPAPAPAPVPTPAPSGRQLRDEPMPSDTRKALDSLKRLGDGKRPVKFGSLRAHLRSHLRADLSEAGVEALLRQMREQGWISELDHGKVAYQLP